MILRILAFLILNFIALAIGGLFTSGGVDSSWYEGLIKAPWTPPGWVFGFAWTSIMICFAFYMGKLYTVHPNKKMILGIYAIHWVLNVLWNPIFFHFQEVLFGLLVIVCLTLLICWLLITYNQRLKNYSWFILPYFLWLLIATSLNAYILVYN